MNEPQPNQSDQSDYGQQPDLEQMAAMMAAALDQLDCPDCPGATHEFIEIGATIHQEELEWACVVHVVLRAQR
ncbi:hypothetical protein [Lacisediminimonas profundi]|uniref:hypothetical protein n=1 Tax=Lacisediminimonas profundi TaxID=2603856 RepID=UPI00124AF294|nr:hypothetical protein [Lacisediminimonas profundi]